MASLHGCHPQKKSSRIIRTQQVYDPAEAISQEPPAPKVVLTG